MEFLIILKPNDFKGYMVCSSYHNKVTNCEDHIPGILNCIDMMTINSIKNHTGIPKYVIRDVALPRVTYIKLPKEEIYVKSDEWEYEYMKSQIQEIILIFGILGAKKIMYDVSDNSEVNKNIGANLGVGEPGLIAEAGLEISQHKSKFSKFSGLVEFPEPKQEIPTLEHLQTAANIFYLPKKYHWQAMVRNRIVSYTSKDTFDYKFGKDFNISGKLSAKFNKIGIGFSMGQDNLTDFQMKFEIEYYSVDYSKIRSLSSVELNIDNTNTEKSTFMEAESNASDSPDSVQIQSDASEPIDPV